MIANIILFVAGSGGNFLARILTLDPATIPIGGDGETASERSELYHYSNIDKLLNKKYNNFNNNGLSDWVEIELNKMFFPMTLGVEKITKMNKILVEPIHPSHYETKLGYFGKDDILKILYIDPIDCEQWITTQRIHKGVVKDNKSFDLQLNRTKFEIEDLHKKSSEAYPISLKNIISSAESFIIEYKKTCQYMNLKSFDNHALKIYESWKETWGEIK